MKSLLGKLGVILIGLAIFGYGEVWGADWKLYFVHEIILNYYDAQSITRPSKNIVRVWTRSNYTEKGVIDIVGRLGKKYENLSDSTTLWEINCLEKKCRFLSIAYHNNKGEPISFFGSPSEWDFIIPETMAEILYKEICK